MKKKTCLVNGSFVVQFSKACYAFMFMREAFPGVNWFLEVNGCWGIVIKAFFDDTPEAAKLCELSAKQLANLVPGDEVKVGHFSGPTHDDPFWFLRAEFELVNG